jgi:hypothetical protein
MNDLYIRNMSMSIKHYSRDYILISFIYYKKRQTIKKTTKKKQKTRTCFNSKNANTFKIFDLMDTGTLAHVL